MTFPISFYTILSQTKTAFNRKNYDKSIKNDTSIDKFEIVGYNVNMVSDLIKNIISYTDLLKNKMHLQVSFSNIVNCFSAYMHLFQPYNIHYNGYCSCIKTNKTTLKICIEKQFKVIEKSKNGDFYGACWAGVEEFVFPIRHGDDVLGFISVSGYRGNIKGSEEKIKRVSEKYDIDYNILKEKYRSSLNVKAPDINELRPLIYPLCYMFELLYISTPQSSVPNESSSLYADILNYLCFNYTRNISLDDIAEAMHYSKSYIRQLFKKYSKSNINHYLTMLRIKRAKELLENTTMSITDIAADTGFCNSNYFSLKFKSVVGVSPKSYRDAKSAGNDGSIMNKFING